MFSYAKEVLNHPDTFHYVCGEPTFKSQRRNFTSLVKICCELYFGRTFGLKIKVRPIIFVAYLV
jgi:hypothetical protein